MKGTGNALGDNARGDVLVHDIWRERMVVAHPHHGKGRTRLPQRVFEEVAETGAKRQEGKISLAMTRPQAEFHTTRLLCR